MGSSKYRNKKCRLTFRKTSKDINPLIRKPINFFETIYCNLFFIIYHQHVCTDVKKSVISNQLLNFMSPGQFIFIIKLFTEHFSRQFFLPSAKNSSDKL